jgi:hypothetical protein
MRLLRLRPWAAALLLLAPAAVPARAQDVRVSGDDQSRAAQVAREILARGSYLRIDRDTTLAASFTTPGDVVIYDAEVRLEGTIEGAVAVVGGHLFIRPRARIGGPIAVLGGDVYTSGLATTGEVLYPGQGTRVVLEGDTAAVVAETEGLDARIVAPPPPRRLGLVTAIPAYDRVNGVTVTGGLSFLLWGERDTGARAEGWLSYRGENPDPVGGGARLDAPLGVQGLRIVAEASRATRTNDAWLRGDLSNSISVATFEKDYRDYYDADRASLMLTRPVNRPLIAGESWLGPRVGVVVEEARSLRAKRVWSVWESDHAGRVNPPVIEETVVSAVAGTELRWVGRTSSFTGDVQVEHAIPGASDIEFTHLLGEGRYQAIAFRTHELEVYFRGMRPLNDGGSPPQRFGILGGGGTLPTIDVGAFRGDRLAYVESNYLIPFPQLEMPYLGFPSLEFTHSAGAAWQTGEDMPPWVQNVGVGLRFSFFRVRVLVDPAVHPLEPKFSFRVALPFRS